MHNRYRHGFKNAVFARLVVNCIFKHSRYFYSLILSIPAKVSNSATGIGFAK